MADHGHTKALSTGRLSDEKSIKPFHETLETSGAVRARKREVSVQRTYRAPNLGYHSIRSLANRTVL